MMSSTCLRWTKWCLNMVGLICLALTNGCGVLPQGEGTAEQPFFKTLNFIQQNGLPKFSTLVPSLPSHFSRVSGIKTNDSGLPELPENFSSDSLTTSVANFESLLAEAQSLSSQGFSEARRIEALLHNFVRPVYDLLGESDIFQKTAGNTDIRIEDILNGIIADPGTSSAVGVNNIFDEFYQTLSFAVDMGDVEGFPNKLLFSGGAGSDSISISGLFENGTSFDPGFKVSMRLDALDDMDLTFAIQPKFLSGFISEWKAGGCDNDVFSLSLKTSADQTGATISSLECPDSDNAISSLNLTKIAEGTLNITGSFARSYPDAHSDSLRSWLGKRQGFVLQAAVPAELDKVAAAAAVLSESDFANPNQAMIDDFGIGALLTKFVREKFWSPKLASAKIANGQSVFGFPSASAATNIAWWSCYQSTFKALVNTSALCDEGTIDVEAMLSSFTKIDDAFQSFSLPGVNLDSVKKTSASIVSILKVRNSLFIKNDGSFDYKNTDDSSLIALDTERSQLGVAALDNLSWKENLGLESLTDADIPLNPFQSVASSLSGYLSKGCQNWRNEVDEESGKSGQKSCL